MKRKIIIGITLAALIACPLFAQTDSLEVTQSSEKIIIVTLDPVSEDRLASIDDSAKPYSLKELFQFPKGLDSDFAFCVSHFAKSESFIIFVKNDLI